MSNSISGFFSQEEDSQYFEIKSMQEWNEDARFDNPVMTKLNAQFYEDMEELSEMEGSQTFGSSAAMGKWTFDMEKPRAVLDADGEEPSHYFDIMDTEWDGDIGFTIPQGELDDFFNQMEANSKQESMLETYARSLNEVMLPISEWVIKNNPTGSSAKANIPQRSAMLMTVVPLLHSSNMQFCDSLPYAEAIEAVCQNFKKIVISNGVRDREDPIMRRVDYLHLSYRLNKTGKDGKSRKIVSGPTSDMVKMMLTVITNMSKKVGPTTVFPAWVLLFARTMTDFHYTQAEVKEIIGIPVDHYVYSSLFPLIANTNLVHLDPQVFNPYLVDEFPTVLPQHQNVIVALAGIYMFSTEHKEMIEMLEGHVTIIDTDLEKIRSEMGPVPVNPDEKQMRCMLKVEKMEAARSLRINFLQYLRTEIESYDSKRFNLRTLGKLLARSHIHDGVGAYVNVILNRLSKAVSTLTDNLGGITTREMGYEREYEALTAAANVYKLVAEQKRLNQNGALFAVVGNYMHYRTSVYKPCQRVSRAAEMSLIENEMGDSVLFEQFLREVHVKRTAGSSVVDIPRDHVILVFAHTRPNDISSMMREIGHVIANALESSTIRWYRTYLAGPFVLLTMQAGLWPLVRMCMYHHGTITECAKSGTSKTVRDMRFTTAVMHSIFNECNMRDKDSYGNLSYKDHLMAISMLNFMRMFLPGKLVAFNYMPSTQNFSTLAIGVCKLARFLPYIILGGRAALKIENDNSHLSDEEVRSVLQKAALYEFTSAWAIAFFRSDLDESDKEFMKNQVLARKMFQRILNAFSALIINCRARDIGHGNLKTSTIPRTVVESIVAIQNLFDENDDADIIARASEFTKLLAQDASHTCKISCERIMDIFYFALTERSEKIPMQLRVDMLTSVQIPSLWDVNTFNQEMSYHGTLETEYMEKQTKDNVIPGYGCFGNVAASNNRKRKRDDDTEQKMQKPRSPTLSYYKAVEGGKEINTADFFVAVMNGMACLQCKCCLAGRCNHMNVCFKGGDANYRAHPVVTHAKGFSTIETSCPVTTGIEDDIRFTIAMAPLLAVEKFISN